MSRDTNKPKDATNDKLKKAWEDLSREANMPFGHQFNDEMKCSCGISWSRHQVEPTFCEVQPYRNLKKEYNHR